QLVLGRRLHRQVSWLLALEDAIDVVGRTPVLHSDLVEELLSFEVHITKPYGSQSCRATTASIGSSSMSCTFCSLWRRPEAWRRLPHSLEFPSPPSRGQSPTWSTRLACLSSIAAPGASSRRRMAARSSSGALLSLMNSG